MGLILYYLPGRETLGQETNIKMGPEVEKPVVSYKAVKERSPHKDATLSAQDSNTENAFPLRKD